MDTAKLKPIKWSDETLEQAINGAFTVTRMGQSIPYELTPQEKQVFAQAKQQGYLPLSKRNNLRHVFCTWCEIHKLPYVYIEKRGKYASVKMDLIFCEEQQNKQDYREDNLFNIKLLTVVSVAGVNNTDFGVGGTYNHVSSVLPEHADYVAQSFLAIYRQFTGEDVKAPAFPEGVEKSVLRTYLQESREHRYAHSDKDRNRLVWRWETFCEAYRWPYIEVDEKRKGTAKIEIKLPDLVTFRPEVVQAITRLAQEFGLKSDDQAAKNSDKRFYCTDTAFRMLHPTPTANALQLADKIVKVLSDADYFPPVDESWHE